ncbi:MAG: DUF839 domain-containing protein [Bryobacterales bacterium]|nr:DUF839 domain-containing protein [Bryobacterales bacterium]
MTLLDRRTLLRQSGALALGMFGLQNAIRFPVFADVEAGPYGALEPDPKGWLDLPKSFHYTALSPTGETMDDGLLVPPAHDGMAAFAGPGGTTIVIRNHEVGPGGRDLEHGARLTATHRQRFYDSGLGGTTTLVFDTRTQKLQRHFQSLGGTLTNCAGGPTPWGSWISCEETVQRAEEDFAQDHGYCFEVPASATGLVQPVPLRAMGRFVHEAIAIDPRTGIVYLTEDRGDSLFYRFLPSRRGRLDAGRLQALMVLDQKSFDTRNVEETRLGLRETLQVGWIDVENADSKADELRAQGFANGAARFARGEGIWMGDSDVWIVCTSGGHAKKGQIFRYTPSPREGRKDESKAPAQLHLFVEPNDESVIENPDNVTVAPSGDLFVCEDGPGTNYVRQVTPDGRVYPFAKNAHNDSEFCGAAFSPDGTTMFVNIQRPGVTLAITGPWKRAS